MTDAAAMSVEEATREVLDGIEDRLGALEALIPDAEGDSQAVPETVAEMRRIVHSIKGSAAGAGASAVRVIAHRLEDYLADVERLEGTARADVQIFVDRLAEALEGRLDPPPEETAQLCRGLPAKHGFDVAEIEARDIEIMLVMPQTAGATYVARELAECGYRMITVWSAPDALALAATMRPDFVIASNVMADLSGVDVVCALRAMPSTAGIPLAVLSSEKREHPSLAGLPAEVPLLSKSQRFADEMTEVFSRAGLL